ncbi:HAD family hydrolase [Nocardia takedensis]|uniref:HAD family hydrolase n=1 Tax=Nocardia takedensis TaxID=259390 RepID=UPI0006879213|nr:HAD family hydrolase [Nocardia takedensis]
MTGTLRKLVAARPLLLLDFDGPVCSVFAGLSSREVARQLSDALGAELPSDLSATADPFEILQYAAEVSPATAVSTERELTRLEVRAVAVADPTPHAHEVIRAGGKRHRVAVVSNNSVAAIDAYLRAHDLREQVAGIFARTSAATALKPAPDLLCAALEELGFQPDQATFTGDSITDLQAANAATIPAIGFANKPGKAERFADYQPAATITGMSELSDALCADSFTA